MTSQQDPLLSARIAQRRVQEKYESQLQTLENDKVSLLKRMNAILVELDQINEEKGILQKRIEDLMFSQSDIQKKIDHEDSLKNAMNKNLNEDLRYEREINDKLRDQLKRLELERGHLMIQLREQETSLENYQKEQHDISRNLQKKADDISELELLRVRTLDNLAIIKKQLEQVTMREGVAKSDSQLYKEEVDQLAKDRDDLIYRMNELTNKYEDFLKAQDAEAGEMREHHRSLNKILTSKLMLGSLDKIASKTRRSAFKKIQHFASHITKQETTMRRCLNICMHSREYLAQLYFWKWYSRSMSFLNENTRIDNVVERRVNARTRASFFYHWREAFLKSVKSFDRKAEGIRLWHVLFKRQNYLSVKVAFQRWGEKIEHHYEQRGELKRLIRQRIFGQMEQAYLRWCKFSRRQREREQLDKLNSQYSRLRYLQHMFSNFKVTCRDLISQKLIAQFKTWKGWRDAYKRRIFLGNAEKAGTRLAMNYEEGLMRACFNAFTVNVQMEKYNITMVDLEQERKLRQEAEVQLKLDRHHQLERVRYKGTRDVIKQLRSVLWSWFEHWKNATFKHKEKVRTTFKMMVITWARRFTQQAMQRWKASCDLTAYETQMKYHQETLLENSELEIQIKLLQDEQNKRGEKVKLRKMTKLHNTIKRLTRRILRNFVRRWRENANAKNDMFFASMKCSRKLYIRTMKERFNQYREGVKHVKIIKMLKGRFDDITKNFDSRLLDRTFDAWCHFIEQRKFMTKALCRIGMGLKGQNVAGAFMKWREVKNYERYNDLQNESMTMMNTSQVLLGELDDLKAEEARSQQQAEMLYRKMIKQAERVMSNFVVRCLNSTLGKGFYTWKDIVFDEKKKVNLIRRAFLSLIFSSHRAAFSKWRDYVKWYNKNEFYIMESRMKREIEDVNTSRLLEADLSANEISRLQIEVMQKQRNFDEYSMRHGKQLESMIKKKGKFFFCSKKRMIFEAWRDYMAQERGACGIIMKVMRHANRRIAFSQIRGRAFEEGRSLNHQLRMNRVWMKFIKGQLQSAFSKWRGGSMMMVKCEFNSVLDMTMQTQQLHMSRIVDHKERVAVKAARAITQHKQYNVFYSWFHIIKAWRALRVKGNELKQRLMLWRAKVSLHKWRARKNATKRMRAKMHKAVQFDRSLNMSRGFAGIHDIGKGETNLAKVLRRIDNRVNHIAKFNAFHAIDRNSRHHERNKAREKQHGKSMIGISLQKMFRRTQREAFHSLRTLALEQGGHRLNVRKIMMQCMNRNMRHYFKKWLKQTDNFKMVDVVTYEGSTAMAQRDHMINEHVIKKVVKEQGYTMDQVARHVDQSVNRQQRVAYKYYSLIMDTPDKNRTVAFHAWRKFVDLRKKIREKAGLCLNLLSKNDSFRALRTWKLCVFGSRKRLMRMRKEHLISRIIDNSRDVSLGEDLIFQRGHAINHVTNQREILMMNYISSQKLGLSCMRLFAQRQVQHAFNLWKRHLKQGSEAELRVEAKKLAVSIDTVKENLDLLKEENEKLVEENEELRQASLDGIEIAMAVQELTKEREQLSVDLADRAITIKKLLEENQNLMNTLKEVDIEMERLQGSLQ